MAADWKAPTDPAAIRDSRPIGPAHCRPSTQAFNADIRQARKGLHLSTGLWWSLVAINGDALGASLVTPGSHASEGWARAIAWTEAAGGQAKRGGRLPVAQGP